MIGHRWLANLARNSLYIVWEAKYRKMCGGNGMIKQRYALALYDLATSFSLNNIHINDMGWICENICFDRFVCIYGTVCNGCGGPKHTHNKTAKGNKTGMIVIIHQSELANCLGWMRYRPLSISRNNIPRCSRLCFCNVYVRVPRWSSGSSI